jgi:hypothetical protein
VTETNILTFWVIFLCTLGLRRCQNAQKNDFWGRFKVLEATLGNFCDFVIFLLILVDFLLNKRFIEWLRGGTTVWADWVPPLLILTYDPL